MNTGVRDDVVCILQWSWEIEVTELGISVLEVPREHVKGRRRPRVVVCNSVARSIIDSQRGKHDDFVFVRRRERVKNLDVAPVMSHQPIQTMNNTAWQNARKKAGMPDLHVHALRHTAGVRLREATVPEPTICGVPWHVSASITHHQTVAQIVEPPGAPEKTREKRRSQEIRHGREVQRKTGQPLWS